MQPQITLQKHEVPPHLQKYFQPKLCSSCYICHLVQIFDEVKRVLRDDGTCWINIADSYAGSGSGGGGNELGSKAWFNNRPTSNMRHPILKPKDLCLIPERLMIALQDAGWWVRSVIVWSKNNCMPSSVTDRPTTSHEYVILLAKSKKYYYDADAIREPSQANEESTTRATYGRYNAGKGAKRDRREGKPDFLQKVGNDYGGGCRNKRTVWNINTKPFSMEMCKACKRVYEGSEYRRLEKHGNNRVCAGCGQSDSWLSHFATFPPALVEPPILAGSSPQACEVCGAPWERVTNRKRLTRPELPKDDPRYRPNTYKGDYADINGKGDAGYTSVETKGWRPTCQCEQEGTGKSIVLDPFAGSGTTCAVAKKHGRAYIGIEANADYIKLAEARIAKAEREVEEEKRQMEMF